MKIVVVRWHLVSAIKLVAAFAKPNKSLSILESICLRPSSANQQFMEICSTNLECTGISRIPYDLIDNWGDEEKSGICIPCSTLLKTIEKMPEEDENIYIETHPDTGKIEVRNASGNRVFTFSTVYADINYGEIQGEWKMIAKLSSDIWINLLKKAIHHTTDDDLKPAMQCVRIEGEKTGEMVCLRSIATDAHALSINQECTTFYAGSENLECLLHKNAIAAILPHITGAMPFELLECKTKYGFRFSNAAGFHTQILFQKNDAKFPDYRNVIPRIAGAKAKIICSRKNLIDTMKRAEIYSNNTTRLSKFTFLCEQGNIVVEAEDMESTHSLSEKILGHIIKLDSELPDRLEIGFNSKLFARILANLDCEEILIYYYSEKSAILIEDSGNQFEEIPSKEHILQQRFLLMPIMLNY